MALSEFVAIETAYRALQPLDPSARRRALQWLTDALELPDLLPVAGPEPAPAAPVAEVIEIVAVPQADGATAGDGADGAGDAEPAPVAPARTARRAAPGTRRSRRAARSAKPTVEGGEERVYRRMPPADRVLSAYRQVGTISGLAEYFNVPRHTVQGWARRLRRDGYVIGRGSAESRSPRSESPEA